jgi:hypothetical protein
MIFGSCVLVSLLLTAARLKFPIVNCPKTNGRVFVGNYSSYKSLPCPLVGDDEEDLALAEGKQKSNEISKKNPKREKRKRNNVRVRPFFASHWLLLVFRVFRSRWAQQQ